MWHLFESRTGRPPMRALAAALFSGLLALAAATAGADGARRMQFDIAAQALTTALVKFSEQAGLQFTAPGVSLGEVKSGEVKGEYSPDTALSLLLKDTGFTYRFVDEGTVAIRRATEEKSVATALGSGMRLAQAEQPGQSGGAQTTFADEAQADDVDTVVVSGQRITTTATKTDTPLIETPQSISVISRELMDLRNTQRVREALRFTSGVQVEKYGADSRYDQVELRGFSSTVFGDYRDGLRQPSSFSAYFRNESYGLSGIEVLKGPSSVLYGQNAPGGLVNYVTKLPIKQGVHELQADVGNDSLYQLKLDLGDTLDADGKVLYRLTGVYRDADNPTVNNRPDDRKYLAPAITWQPTDSTTFTLHGTYQDDDAAGQPFYFTRPGNVPTKVSASDPAWDQFAQKQYAIGYLLKHQFSERVAFHQTVRYSNIDLHYKAFGGYFLRPDGHTVDRYAFRSDTSLDNIAVDNQLQAVFESGGITQRLLFGVDYSRTKGDTLYGDTISLVFTPQPPFDLITPTPITTPITVPTDVLNLGEVQKQAGLYVQDQIKSGSWVFTLGGRYDDAKSESIDHLAAARTNQSDNKFTARGGIAYLFDSGFAPYFSYATSFQLTPGTDFNGSAFKPSLGNQAEIGVKYQPPTFPGFITASLFDLTQQDVLTQDPLHVGFSVQTGEIRSRGVEVEGAINPTRGLNIGAAYTFLDNEVTESNGPDLHKTQQSTPRNSGSLWFDHTLQDGGLDGIGFGAAVRYVGKSFADIPNTVRNGSATFMDAQIHYDRDKWRAALNVNNVFDEEKYTCNFGFCYIYPPRTVIGSLRYRW